MYVRSSDGQTKGMYFLTEFDNLLEKYHSDCNKVSGGIKKAVDSESVNNKKFKKNKIKSNGDEVTDFSDKQIPKVDSNHTYLVVIILDSGLKNRVKLLYASIFKKVQIN